MLHTCNRYRASRAEQPFKTPLRRQKECLKEPRSRLAYAKQSQGLRGVQGYEGTTHLVYLKKEATKFRLPFNFPSTAGLPHRQNKITTELISLVIDKGKRVVTRIRNQMFCYLEKTDLTLMMSKGKKKNHLRLGVGIHVKRKEYNSVEGNQQLLQCLRANIQCK